MEPIVEKIASGSRKGDMEQYELQKSGVDNKNKEIETGSSPESNSLMDYEDEDDYNDEYNDDEYGYETEEDTGSYSKYQDLFDSKDLPPGVEVSMDWFPDSSDKETAKPSTSSKTSDDAKKPAKGTGIHSPFFSSDLPTPVAQQWKAPLLAPVPNHVDYHQSIDAEVLTAPDATRVKRNMQDFFSKYVFFKRFDMVEDYSDHYYASKGSSTKRHTKEWVRRIQEEWKSLEHDLPEMIFVRGYESRLDLLRAVILGPQGTPYHDGLFFFDIYFPDAYPSVPPLVHYQSGGLRINPNLYNCGKVCLSLLGTWSGRSAREKWIPNDSTMLQVLVSIQGLILNEKPYFNEPGYEDSAGTREGEAKSKAYSENTFLLSLRTMVYNMRRPPKYFEDFAYGHFFSCANDVLKACAAYRNGAPMASKIKVKNVDNVTVCEQSCSGRFRSNLTTLVETVLLPEFILLGVPGLEPVNEQDKPAQSSTKT